MGLAVEPERLAPARRPRRRGRRARHRAARRRVLATIALGRSARAALDRDLARRLARARRCSTRQRLGDPRPHDAARRAARVPLTNATRRRVLPGRQRLGAAAHARRRAARAHRPRQPAAPRAHDPARPLDRRRPRDHARTAAPRSPAPPTAPRSPRSPTSRPAAWPRACASARGPGSPAPPATARASSSPTAAARSLSVLSALSFRRLRGVALPAGVRASAAAGAGRPRGPARHRRAPTS